MHTPEWERRLLAERKHKFRQEDVTAICACGRHFNDPIHDLGEPQ